MNPEFERNIWLEMTPQRVLLMAAVLALVFFAAALSKDSWTPSVVASWLYYLIVVVWGSRSAALSVVGEIRDRTWDGQRLSALGAGDMTWGKLFGATIYNWFGGAICLTLAIVNLATHLGPATAAIELLYYIGIGMVAQAAALLASLIAVGRGQSHTRFEIFVYQMAGVAAAIGVWWLWSEADPVAALLAHKTTVDHIVWWGATLDAPVFLLVSLALFAGWTLVGCYREMRLELKMRNGPLVWLGFLAFCGIYFAGFDAFLSKDVQGWDAVALRLLFAGTVFAGLTYVMVLLEPKDRVHYRWIAAQLGRGQVAAALGGLQAWMMSYAGALLMGGALCLWLLHDPDAARQGQPFILTALGFLTRDVSLFVLMTTLSGRRRGDYAALAVLFAVYVLVPAILIGLDNKGLLFLFYPQVSEPNWTGATAAWIEGVVVATAAISRLALSEKRAA